MVAKVEDPAKVEPETAAQLNLTYLMLQMVCFYSGIGCCCYLGMAHLLRVDQYNPSPLQLGRSYAVGAALQ